MSAQNDISSLFLDASGLQEREGEVLKDAISRTGFVPKNLLNKSHWWGSKEVGAYHYAGEYQGKRAIMKIQGVKPQTSEAVMIQEFDKAKANNHIRPPQLYAHIPWKDDLSYEVLILEWIKDEKIVQKPALLTDVVLFFSIYENYRESCLSSPWLEKPEGDAGSRIHSRFETWKRESRELYPDHPLRKSEDTILIDQAVAVLGKEYAGVELDFQHGHFSTRDLFWMNGTVVLLSNLYWGWKAPLYDLVFGYHWFMYDLAEVRDITHEVIEDQRQMWMDGMNYQARTPEKQHFLKVALLERAAAGLNLDALLMDPKKSHAEYMMNRTREELQSLLSQLS